MNEAQKSCIELGKYLIEAGYVSKIEGITIKNGSYGYPLKTGDYYVVYYNQDNLLKWFDNVMWKGLPVFVAPFTE